MNFHSIFLLAVFLLCCSLASFSSGLRSTASPFGSGWGPEPVAQHSGYITVDTQTDNGGHIFFWLFESRSNPSTDPLILWMTGGPGCSSELAIFMENGPYRVNISGSMSGPHAAADSNFGVTSNAWAWNTNANVLFVDQPVGTGFSYADFPDDYVTNEKQVGEDMYEMMQGFYNAFPKYAKLDFYVTGESYAGHYVPSVTSRIFQGNQNLQPGYIHIPLKGMAIGNGLTMPQIQYGQYGQYAYDNQKISLSQFQSINSTIQSCVTLIGQNSFLAPMVCNPIVSTIQAMGGDFNVYNIELPCSDPGLCYNMSNIDYVVQQPSVQASLGVNTAKAQWSECNYQVHMDLTGDWFTNCETYIPPLLEAGIKVLIYAGKLDFICNWYGNREWVAAMPWSGQQNYNSQPFHDWIVNGQQAGVTKTSGNLTFLGVNGAGHLVPFDQPMNSNVMINNWIHGKPF